MSLVVSHSRNSVPALFALPKPRCPTGRKNFRCFPSENLAGEAKALPTLALESIPMILRFLSHPRQESKDSWKKSWRSHVFAPDVGAHAVARRAFVPCILVSKVMCRGEWLEIFELASFQSFTACGESSIPTPCDPRLQTFLLRPARISSTFPSHNS